LAAETILVSSSVKPARRWAEVLPRGRFWSLFAAVLLFNVGVAVYFFLYNLFMLDLGYREGPLGVLAGALAFGSMAGTIPMGFVAQRLGARRTLVTCLLAVSIAFGARLFLLWYPMQVAFAFCDGVLLCGWAVCLSPAVASIVEERRRPAAFSILFAAAVAAGSLGGFLGGNLPDWCHAAAQHWWRIAISSTDAKRATLLAACCLTCVAAWPVARGSAIQQEFTGVASHSWIRRPPSFLKRYLIASACWAGAVGAFNPFTNVFFVRYVGVATAHLGNFFAVAQLLQAAAVLCVPLLLRRTGIVGGIVTMQAATAVAVALLSAGRGIVTEEFLYCALMAAQHMCDPAMQTLLMDRVPPSLRNGASALNFLAVSLAQSAAATVSGAAIQRFGYPAVLAAIAVAVLMAAAGFRLLMPRESAVQAGELSGPVDPTPASAA